MALFIQQVHFPCVRRLLACVAPPRVMLHGVCHGKRQALDCKGQPGLFILFRRTRQASHLETSVQQARMQQQIGLRHDSRRQHQARQCFGRFWRSSPCGLHPLEAGAQLDLCCAHGAIKSLYLHSLGASLTQVVKRQRGRLTARSRRTCCHQTGGMARRFGFALSRTETEHFKIILGGLFPTIFA